MTETDYEDYRDEFDGFEDGEEDIEDLCVECGRKSFDACICGNPLCPMCFELGAGFCSQTSNKTHEKLCKESLI